MINKKVINEFYLPNDLLIQQYVFILGNGAIAGGYCEAIEGAEGVTVGICSFIDIEEMLMLTQDFIEGAIENHNMYTSKKRKIQIQEETNISAAELEHYENWIEDVNTYHPCHGGTVLL